MRSLPWLKADNDKDTESENEVKKGPKERKKVPAPPKSEVESEEAIDDSVSVETAVTQASDGDNAYDAMIPGYDNDDAYIMVEHDLLEAAKLVTRELHLEAYLKHATAPVEKTILRPTIGGTPKKRKAQEISEGFSDVEDTAPRTLGELLTQRPADRGAAATPIKRRNIDSTSQQRKSANAKSEVENEGSPVRATTKAVMLGPTDIRRDSNDRISISKKEETEEEDDDEDLDKPIRKKVPRLPPQAHLKISFPPFAAKRDAAQAPSGATSTKPPSGKSFDPDWLFDSLWEEPKRPLGPAANRNKVSLASQLEESTFKILGKKKPMSLKEQFKFLDS
jgi:hypothetical protein